MTLELKKCTSFQHFSAFDNQMWQVPVPTEQCQGKRKRMRALQHGLSESVQLPEYAGPFSDDVLEGGGGRGRHKATTLLIDGPLQGHLRTKLQVYFTCGCRQR